MPTYIYNGGAWKQVMQIFVREGGAWEPANDAHIRHSDSWKSVLYESGSQGFISTGSSTFTVPAGVVSLTATVIGAGGGGGGCHSSGDLWVGGGGGAGGRSTATAYAVTPGEELTVFVGEGGCWGHTYFNGWLNQSCRGTGISHSHGEDGEDSYVTRGSTDIVRATGGEGGPQGLGQAFDSPRGSWNNGDQCVQAVGGMPQSNATNAKGEQSAATGCYGYGYQGPQAGGVNGSSYGNGGDGGYSGNAGDYGEDGYILLAW